MIFQGVIGWQGLGAVSLDGKLVDIASIKQATGRADLLKIASESCGF